MLRIDRTGQTLNRIQRQSLSDAGIKEREHLQQLIKNSPKAFFEEIDEELILLGEELRPSDDVDNRIDLLALDKDAVIVVIELKRDSHRYQLLQALAYAAMIADWGPQKLVEARAGLVGRSADDAEEEIESFLATDLIKINHRQRLILLAEAFDYEVLVTAEWLTESYGLDIRCYQCEFVPDGKAQYLQCSCVYPPLELRERARRRSIRRQLTGKWPDWETALQFTDNEDQRHFFLREINGSCKKQLHNRRLIYLAKGKQCWYVRARRHHAYVHQVARFVGDVKFWTQRIDKDADIMPIDNGHSLRFYLRTASDFEQFKLAVTRDPASFEFLSAADLSDAASED